MFLFKNEFRLVLYYNLLSDKPKMATKKRYYQGLAVSSILLHIKWWVLSQDLCGIMMINCLQTYFLWILTRVKGVGPLCAESDRRGRCAFLTILRLNILKTRQRCLYGAVYHVTVDHCCPRCVCTAQHGECACITAAQSHKTYLISIKIHFYFVIFIVRCSEWNLGDFKRVEWGKTVSSIDRPLSPIRCYLILLLQFIRLYIRHRVRSLLCTLANVYN